MLNFSSSQSLLDRRAVLLTGCDVLSPLGSRGAVLLLHEVNGGPQSTVNNGIPIPDGVSTLDNIVGEFLVVNDRLVRTSVWLGQMLC